AEAQKVSSLAALRAIPSDALLKASRSGGDFRFGPNIDGYYFPESPALIYAQGKQHHVSLLAGWNAQEMSFQPVMSKITTEKFHKQIHDKFPQDEAEVLKLYPSTSEAESMTSAIDLAGDQFIAFSTWKWIEMQRKTARKPVYEYLFSRVR